MHTTGCILFVPSCVCSYRTCVQKKGSVVFSLLASLFRVRFGSAFFLFLACLLVARSLPAVDIGRGISWVVFFLFIFVLAYYWLSSSVFCFFSRTTGGSAGFTGACDSSAFPAAAPSPIFPGRWGIIRAQNRQNNVGFSQKKRWRQLLSYSVRVVEQM